MTRTDDVENNDMSHVAKKTEFRGEYLYRGYLLSKHVNENECCTGEWDISEEVKHSDWNGGPDWFEWEACDTFATLRDCKGMIDHWHSNTEEGFDDDN